MRRTLIALFLVALASASTAGDAAAQAERFLGAWTLVEWTNVRDGETFYPYGENPAGQIVYTPTGRMTAALMNPRPGENPQQFVAYWGSYTVDMAAGTVTHHVEGSFSAGMMGTDQVRSFRFEGEDRIVLSPGGQSELTWVKVR
ncbi:MAG: lipocalin-like domain-containing protein [Gemmatimonadota bacterium]|nr:lipocalin-like domain-containing protein [Gemmatimonadota bacterium]MDH3423088.1 lipocalin-like domain-containing protein [Gemmatimonadota bacterium]